MITAFQCSQVAPACSDETQPLSADDGRDGWLTLVHKSITSCLYTANTKTQIYIGNAILFSESCVYNVLSVVCM